MKSLLTAFVLFVVMTTGMNAQITWQSPALTGQTVKGLVLSPNGYLFCSSVGGRIFRSTDNGATWNLSNSGVGNFDLGRISIGSQGYLYAASWGGGVYKSVDNGATWQQSNSGLNIYLTNIATGPGGRMLATTANDGFYYSLDAGASWTKVTSVLSTVQTSGAAIKSNGMMFASSTGNGTYRSTNDGTTWTNITGTMPPSSGNQIAIAPNGDTYSGCWGGGMYKSTDNGGTWTQVAGGFGSGYPLNWVFDPNGTIYCGTLNGIFVSTDNGGTWTTANTGLVQFGIESMTISVNRYLFASHSGGVQRSGQPLTAVRENVGGLPNNFSLAQNYPNPFNPTTEIRFQIPVSSHVTLKAFDVLGREVATLVNEELKAGSYETTFNADGLASGVYFYKLQTGAFAETKKMILTR